MSEAGVTVPSVRSELARPIVTSAAGMLFRTTVKFALPPASVVTSPLVGLTVIPAVSSSVLVTAEVVMLRLHPPAMVPAPPEKSSRT